MVQAHEWQVQVTEIIVKVLPDGRMDSRNAAAYLGLAVKTLTMMRCYGTGPKFIKRGHVFYYRGDLDAWLRAGPGPAPRTPRGRALKARGGSGKR